MEVSEYAYLLLADEYGQAPRQLSPSYEVAPHATPPRSKRNRRTRRMWIKMDRQTALEHIDSRLVGESNMRYRDRSYSELCHHQTAHWDNHPFCPECYRRYQHPFCSKYGPLECEWCELNSDDIDTARNLRLNRKSDHSKAVNRDLPINCYTQADCDEYIRVNGYTELPNPAWFIDGQPNGQCFPTSLITEEV